MFIIALTAFIASIVVLGALFTLKHIELQRGAAYMPHIRARADQHALYIKTLCNKGLIYAEKLPQDMAVSIRFSVHMGAIMLAHIARAAEVGAHKLADRISHKHQFERGESRSEFLKSVREHKDTLEQGLQ